MWSLLLTSVLVDVGQRERAQVDDDLTVCLYLLPAGYYKRRAIFTG